MNIVYQNDYLNEKTEIVNTVINEIFQLTYNFKDADYINIRTFDKFERDVFALDNARFQLEIVLTKLGVSVAKYYDYKFEAIDPNDDEYRSFSYSFAALITLWKNFCKGGFTMREIEDDLIEKSFELFINNLIEAKKIIENNCSEVCNDLSLGVNRVIAF